MYRIKKVLSIFMIFIMGTAIFSTNTTVVRAESFSSDAFADGFKDPKTEYRPKVRWWWPGGDVTEEELRREVEVLYDAGFGGAEIQPFNYSLDYEEIWNADSPIKDYMSEEFLSKVSSVLNKAQDFDMVIDINMGSGYTAGGDFVPLEDNEKTLMSADITVNKSQISATIPSLGPNYMYEQFTPKVPSTVPALQWHTMNYMPEKAELIQLYAAKIVGDEGDADYKILDDTVILEQSSVELIDDYNMDEGTFNWECPDVSENWKIIAVYSMPVGSNPIGTVEVGAEGETAYMVDVLNYAAGINYYENWMEQIESLMPYTEDGTLRAAFNDSFEFFAQRIYSEGVFERFKKINGYDITPYLPVLLKPGADQVASFFVPNRAPEYSFEDAERYEVNERINYDYNKAISSKIMDGWYAATNEKLDNTNLLYRQQGYNPPMDRIKATRYADIPEAENNTVTTNKVITSGAYFYDKPITTAETFVFYTDEEGGGNYKMTPEIYRQQADTMIVSGINEMIYHGFPYVYNDDAKSYGVQNWSAFCSPYSGYDIATTFSESDPYWSYIKSLNQYVSRLQYLMKQGEPSTDVLVYLPLFSSETNYSYITEMLDNNGIAWNWINEELIEGASVDGEKIVVNDKLFDALIIPNVDSIPISTMNGMNDLSKEGAPIAVYGTVASRQPSFNNGKFERLDKEVEALAQEVIGRSNSPLIMSEEELISFVAKYVEPEIKYAYNKNLDFVRRNYAEMGELIFIRNNSVDTTDFSITLEDNTKYAYLMDAKTGDIFPVNLENGIIRKELNGLESLVLLLSDNQVFSSNVLSVEEPFALMETVDETLLDKWILQVDGQVVADATSTGEEALKLWKDIDVLKYSAEPGIYKSKFYIEKIDQEDKYVLQLGELYGVPEISVNDSEYVAIPMKPYELDISRLLKEGENSISIRLTVGLRNQLIGYAELGEDGNGLNKEFYTQFAGSNLIKTGMVEPATIVQKSLDYDAVGVAKKLNILDSSVKNGFNPETELSRRDMVSIIKKTLESVGMPITTDIQDEIDAFMVEPNESVSRAEVAVLIHKILVK